MGQLRKTVLPSWAGFQERLGSYAWESSSKPSTGEVHLSVSGSDENKPAPPSEAQAAAFRYLKDNDKVIHEKVINAIFENYSEWRHQYKDFLGDQLDEQMPVIQTPSDLKRL